MLTVLMYGLVFVAGVGAGFLILSYENLEEQPIPNWVVVTSGAGLTLGLVSGGVWLLFLKGIIFNFSSTLFALTSYFYTVNVFSEFSKELYFSDRFLGIGNKKYLVRVLEERIARQLAYTCIIYKFDLAQIQIDSSILKFSHRAIDKQIVQSKSIIRYDESTLVVVLDYLRVEELETLAQDLKSTLVSCDYSNLDSKLNLGVKCLSNTFGLSVTEVCNEIETCLEPAT